MELSRRVVEPAVGRLGVLLVGLGAVASTVVAGVELVKRGLGVPVGSLAELGVLDLDDGGGELRVREVVPLAGLDELVFGAWDPISDSAYDAALKCGVLDRYQHIEPIGAVLKELQPMPAVFDRAYVPRLEGDNVKPVGVGKRALAEALRADIRAFKAAHGCARLVVIWCASTETFLESGPAHQDLDAFEAAMEANDPSIAPSMLYAYAALREGVPFVNGAPNLTVDIPALVQLAHTMRVPIAGKDFKSGQTLLKTVLAPMLEARLLGLEGWYSTNILGNRDGEVLAEPDNFRTKEVSKLGVLQHLLRPERHPQLYANTHHQVHINYYPPRGDNKESWDTLDLTGWLGYPMQLKINFLCRDSILAAPLVHDLILFTDLAHRAGHTGIQDWLSYYFKTPQHPPQTHPEHNLFTQHTNLTNTLRSMTTTQPTTERPDTN